MRATIKMIAERAGVSIGTVDRVLHDRPYVKAEVKERVLRVMEELDYHPNRMASALATSGIHRRFAVVQPAWTGYIGAEMARGVSNFREERRDYNVDVTVTEYPLNRTDLCLEALDRLSGAGVQGVALCASDCAEVRRKVSMLAERNIPVVTFNSDIAGTERLCYVGEDSWRAGRIAGEIAAKFHRPGHRLLLAYGDPEYAGHKARAQGFLERLKEQGVPTEDCRVAVTHEDYAETVKVVTAALEEEPELAYIYMANASVPACVEAIRACDREGRVRVLTHDNSPENRALLQAGTVDFVIGQNLAYQSYKALAVLFDAAAERKLPERSCFYPETPIFNAENC